LLHGVVQGVLAAKPEMREDSVTSECSQSGQSGSFDELFLAHYGRIVSLLRRLVGDQGHAEDLTSEVFLKLYRRAVPPDVNVPGWLYRSAINLGIDHLRARARRYRYEQEAARAGTDAQHVEDGLEQVLRAECQQRVRFVLAEMKPEQAEMLLSRASGHSYRELAERLAVDPGSIGTRLIRAEAAFEKRYREMFGAEEDL
jgi:RNA polymerase sigma factor (sigma-70 family)